MTARPDEPTHGEVERLIARYDGRVPRYTSYPTAPNFTPAVGASLYARWLEELPPDAPLSLYLHVPFCDRLCLYCGCNTSVVRLETSHRRYAARSSRRSTGSPTSSAGGPAFRMSTGAAARRRRFRATA